MVEQKPPRLGRFLIVNWQSGGGTQPGLGIGRLLSARGYNVDVLAPATQRERVQVAGCDWLPFPPEAEFDPTRGRALEDQDEFVVEMLTGMTLPEALLGAVEHQTPDVLVVDHQLGSVLSAAERTRLPTAALVHTPFRFHGDLDDPDWDWARGRANETRRKLGLPPLPRRREKIGVTLQRRCERAIVVMPCEFDPRDESPPNLVHVGPIFEEDKRSVAWEPPWPAHASDPLVVVSLSSQYMHQETALERILAAVDGLALRILVTTGFELNPRELSVPPGVVVEGYVPHVVVLPEAALVVTHAGMGTVMAAFAHGVPMVCMPLGRDQPGNARCVEELGAGVAVSSDATTEEIRSTLLAALASDALRAGAGRMAEVVQRYGQGELAVRELESLVP